MHEAWDSRVDSSFQQSTWVQLQSKAKKRTEEKIDSDPRVTWAFLVAQQKRIHLQCKTHRRQGFDPWFRKIPWRRAWQPTPVLRLRSLASYSSTHCKESDTVEATEHTCTQALGLSWCLLGIQELLLTVGNPGATLCLWETNLSALVLTQNLDGSDGTHMTSPKQDHTYYFPKSNWKWCCSEIKIMK